MTFDHEKKAYKKIEKGRNELSPLCPVINDLPAINEALKGVPFNVVVLPLAFVRTSPLNKP